MVVQVEIEEEPATLLEVEVEGGILLLKKLFLLNRDS